MSKIREKRARKKIIKKPQKNCKKHRAQKKKITKKKCSKKKFMKRFGILPRKTITYFFGVTNSLQIRMN